MAKMKSDTPLDYAVFQLSPKHSRCELFVFSDGSTEKIASGLLKPFVAHLKVAEEQVAAAAQSVKLEIGRRKNAESWFTKGTLERFVRFVSTPEVLELVNTFDDEMSQLEAARRIYSQGTGDQLSGVGGSGVTAADDATKKELLRAIDVRLVVVRQDLSTACDRATAAGFNIDAVSELQMFADRFGAQRLNEACCKFITVCERRPDLISQLKPESDDGAIRSSYGSDMSIDDDPPSPPPSGLHQRQQVSATCQLPAFPSSRESSVDRDNGNKPNDAFPEKERKEETSIPDQTRSIQASQPSRRLSVQDRINMFENKQKENSGEKPVEIRRLSSDVSSLGAAAAEKAVLRRWSGASDMSIDLSAEIKDNESPLSTPSAAAVPQIKSFEGKKDAATSSYVKPEIKVIPSLNRVGDGDLKDALFNKSEARSDSIKSNSNLGSGNSDGLKDQVPGRTQSSSFISLSGSQENSSEKFKYTLGGKNEDLGFCHQGKLQGLRRGEELSGAWKQVDGVKDQGSLIQIMPIGITGGGQVGISNQREDSESREQSVMHTLLRGRRKTLKESGLFEDGTSSRIGEAFAARYKGIEQQEVSSAREAEVIEKKDSHSIEKVSCSSISSVEDSGSQRMKFNRRGMASEQSKKSQIQKDEISFVGGNVKIPFSGKFLTEAQECIELFSTPPPDQAQRIRQSKGNQELNDELKMKANELEMLFAQHKLRVPGDQSNSGRKSGSADIRIMPASKLQFMEPVADIMPQLSDNHQSTEPSGSSKNTKKFNAASTMKMIDSQDYGDTLKKDFSKLSVSVGFRGKLYDRYMQKRDAKLKEEWSSNRADKETRLKSMQDSLERSRSDMKVKLFGSADRQDSVFSTRRRAERIRSYNSRSIVKREQQYLDIGDSEDNEEALDVLEQKHLPEDRALDDTIFGDSVSRGLQVKKLLPNNRSLSSSTARTSATPISRSSIKTSTINSGRRRMQLENPLAQSVPNFSELRKENTKPLSGASKAAHSQVRNYVRSKSIREEAAIVKEDKSRRSQSLRKHSVNLNEYREMSPVDSDGVVLTPIKFDQEVLKNVGTKPFLKKGSRTGFVAQASIVRQKVSVESEPIAYEEENDDLASGPDDVANGAKHQGEDEFETLNSEGHKVSANGESRARLESEKFINSGSENGDGAQTLSQVDQDLKSHLPTVITSSFIPVESILDWPGESPMSWNSHIRHPFSYPHDVSDIDVSVDSPVGSPASWNTHSLTQIETDAAGMRKKWGTAQKLMLATNSTHNLSRKDMTRGFKRLLKFGRKNRGSESLVDWVSATTSEGDDDTEDAREPASRSSEDLRKSRMGFSQAQPSDDSFNESEYFNESVQSSQSSILSSPKLRGYPLSGSSIKAPRSFFSLSSFRSKGIDSKPG